jgi:hypothetical protein
VSNTVKGRNVVVAMEIDSIYYPVFCAKAAEFVIDQEEIEVTSVNSTSDREYVGGMSSGLLTMTGVTTVDNTNDRVSILYLMQQAIRRVIRPYKITMTADNTTVKVITFDGLIRTTGISRETNGYSNSNLTVRVTGAIGINDLIAPPEPPACEIEDTIYIDAVAGETSVSDPLLEQDDVVILWASREGQIFEQVVGTPGNAQFSFNGATGTISFDPSNPLNDGEVIAISYKIDG